VRRFVLLEVPFPAEGAEFSEDAEKMRVGW
jgi:hypothetical protein